MIQTSSAPADSIPQPLRAVGPGLHRGIKATKGDDWEMQGMIDIDFVIVGFIEVLDVELSPRPKTHRIFSRSR